MASGHKASSLGRLPGANMDKDSIRADENNTNKVNVSLPASSFTNNENNNNESYISSVGDSADSASNVHVVAAASSSPKSSDLVNSARKSGRSEDRLGGGTTAPMFTPLIESAIAPTLDHEIKGAYQLENDKTVVTTGAAATSDAEIAHSQIGSEGGLTLSMPT